MPSPRSTILLGCLFAVAAATGGYLFVKSRTVQAFGRIVARIPTEERVVALTFDDGPSEAGADGLLALLESRRVHATFFVTGAGLESALDAGRRLVRSGHQLGNHSYSHQRMVFRSQAFIRREIEDTDRLIRQAGHQGEILFRPPYCKKGLGLPWFLHRTGRTTVTFDVEPESFPELEGDIPGTVAHVQERVHPGSIILLHPWYGTPERTAVSLEVTRRIIDRLQADGYRFTTVDQLLAKEH